MKKGEKPPLGIVPSFIKDESRRDDILKAIKRYCDANKNIPLEWIVELNEIISRLNR